MKGKIKDKILEKRGFSMFGREYGSHLSFTFHLITWILIIFIVTILTGWIFIKMVPLVAKTLTLSDYVLLMTAGLVAAYAYETHKMTEQMKENDLRPVILRKGFIENWDTLKFTFDGQKLVSGTLIEFKILRGIAIDISGCIVVGGYKYKLLFTNDVVKIGENTHSLTESLGWMSPETPVYALYRDEEKKKALNDEGNKILLFYRDIEGREYSTIEDKDFIQKSFRW
jgi:hypothetical protein